ncbi:leucyl aminopeptidase, partial [Actinomadura logoneensis]
MTTISLDSAVLTALDADAIVVGVHPAEDGVRPAGADDLDAALSGRLADSLTALGATGKPGEVVKLPTLGSVPAALIVAVGLGEADALDAEGLRRAAGAALRALAGKTRVAVAL